MYSILIFTEAKNDAINAVDRLIEEAKELVIITEL